MPLPGRAVTKTHGTVCLLILYSLWLGSCSPPPATLPPVTGTPVPTAMFTPTLTPSLEPSITETPQIMPTPLSPAEQQTIDTQLNHAAESVDTADVLSLLATGANIN